MALEQFNDHQFPVSTAQEADPLSPALEAIVSGIMEPPEYPELSVSQGFGQQTWDTHGKGNKGMYGGTAKYVFFAAYPGTWRPRDYFLRLRSRANAPTESAAIVPGSGSVDILIVPVVEPDLSPSTDRGLPMKSRARVISRPQDGTS